MTALIDADSLLYKVGFALEDAIDWDCNDNHSHYSNIQQQFSSIKSTIDAILMATGCDDYELWLTGKGNFRCDNPLTYKANREGMRKPADFGELFEKVVKNLGANVAEGLEADDIVVYKKTHYPEDYVLCAIDKDVLYQTEGSHYNYGKDLVITVTSDEAKWFAYYQTLAGDTVDGYSGVPGIGDKRARSILADITDERMLWCKTLLTYRSKGLRRSDAINTMRLANMHQYNGNTVELWNPPKKGKI